MKFGFIMDPIENVNVDADTTFAFMLAAKEAGHEVYYLKMEDLSARGARAFCHLSEGASRQRRDAGNPHGF